MKTEMLKQTVRFDASAQDVFDMLMDAKQHRAFTGEPATISRKEGGQFSMYDGWCLGRQVEIVEGQRIVQAWRAKDWKPGVYSIVTITLTKVNTQSCKLELMQTSVPGQRNLEKMKQGWNEHYWMPMKAYIKEQKHQQNTKPSRQTQTGRILRRVA